MVGDATIEHGNAAINCGEATVTNRECSNKLWGRQQ